MRERRLSQEKNWPDGVTGASSSTGLPSISPTGGNRLTHSSASHGPHSRQPQAPMKAPELLRVIESKDRELRARTDSVNAIRRNFERLSDMYRSDRAELERLRGEMESLRERDAASESERKVLAAMREELESLLNSHKELRETREWERETFNSSSKDMKQRLEEQQSSFVQLESFCNTLRSELTGSEEKLRRVNAELNEARRKVVEFTAELRGRLMSVPVEGNLLSDLTHTKATSTSTSTTGSSSGHHHQVVDTNDDDGVCTSSTYDGGNECNLAKVLSEAWNYVDAFCIMYKHLQLRKHPKGQVGEKEAYEVVISDLIIERESMLRDALFSEERSCREKMYATCYALLRENERKQEREVMSELRAQLDSVRSEMGEQQERYYTNLITLERELTEVKSLHQTALNDCSALQQQREQQQAAFDQQIAQMRLELQRRESLVMEQWSIDRETREKTHAEVLKAARHEGDVALVQQRESLSQEYAEKELLLHNHVEHLEKELQYQREQQKEMEVEMRLSKTALSDAFAMRTAVALHSCIELLLNQENSVRDYLNQLEETQREKLGLECRYALTDIRVRASSHFAAATLSLRVLEAEEANERNVILLEGCTTPVLECERSIFALRLLDERRMTRAETKLAQYEPLKALRKQTRELRKEAFGIASSLRDTIQESWPLLREGMKYTQQLHVLHAAAEAATTATAAALAAREQHAAERQQELHSALAAIERLIAAEEASESAFSCGQCLQVYRRPVTCVPCGHTFCESCLLQHPKNIKRSGGTVAAYYCPECSATTGNALLRVRALESLSGNFGFRWKEVEGLRRALERLS